MGQALFPNGAPQGNPPTGYTTLYAKADGSLCYKTPAGVEVSFSAPTAGYFDLKPISLKDDGANGWSVTTVNGFPTLTALSTNALKQLVALYHIDHDIDLGVSTSNSGAYFHLHWGHNTASPTGNFIIDIKARVALPNGQFATLAPLQFTLTPSAGNIDRNIITELPLPSAWYPYLSIDSIWTLLIERNRGVNTTDTFNNPVYYYSADFHIRGSSRLTTNKDAGTGWVNS